jgi:uncharacterized membrane protein
MASEKRERQRANREAKQAEQAKIDRRDTTIQRAKRIAIWVAVGVVLFIVANLVWGGGDETAAAALIWGT